MREKTDAPEKDAEEQEEDEEPHISDVLERTKMILEIIWMVLRLLEM